MRLLRSLTVFLLAAALLALPRPIPKKTGQFGGTFIGVMVATDGIVIGSDSRSTFLDSQGNSVGYVDRIPKIYASGGAALAAAGLVSVEGELFSSFIRRNDLLLNESANEILYDVALRLPLRNTTNVVMLSAGFVDGDPTICAKIPVEPQSCRHDGYFSNKVSPGLRRWFESRKGRVANTSESADALERAIREAGDLDTAVGGPISLLHVGKDGTLKWLKNPPNDNGWTRVCDIVVAYRNGKTPIFFTNSKSELDRYLDGVCPRGTPSL